MSEYMCHQGCHSKLLSLTVCSFGWDASDYEFCNLLNITETLIKKYNFILFYRVFLMLCSKVLITFLVLDRSPRPEQVTCISFIYNLVMEP